MTPTPPPARSVKDGEPFPVDFIVAELSDTSKPWYRSRTIVALLAALIITALQQFDFLPAWLTQDRLTNVLMIGAPIAVAIWARIVSTAAIGPTPPVENAEIAAHLLPAAEPVLLTSKTNHWYATLLTMALLLGVIVLLAFLLIFKDVTAKPTLVEQSRAAMTDLQRKHR